MPLRTGFAIAAAYAVLGAIGLTLAIPPGYASPIFPAAGLALAAALRFGHGAWPWIWLGSFALNLGHVWLQGGLTLTAAVVAGCIAAGSTLQAALGSRGVVRKMGDAWQRLEREGEILSFLFHGCVVAGLVSATVGVPALWASGVIASSSVAFSWWTWYTGDLLGAAIFAPLVLLFITPDSELRRERRSRIVLPILIALGLSMALYAGATYMERRQVHARLEHDGGALAKRVQDRLITHQATLASLSHFAEANLDFTWLQFQQFTQVSLAKLPDIFALSYNDVVRREDLAAFEARVSRSSPLGSFRVTERDAQRRLVPVTPRPEYVAVRYIVPLQGNAPAVGYDIQSEPVRREAIARAMASDKPSATAPLRLVQETAVRMGVLVLDPVHRHLPGVAEPASKPLGFAVAVLKVDELIALALGDQVPAGLQLQIRDSQVDDPALRFFGQAELAEVPAYRRWETSLSIADRQWTLSLRAEDAYVNQGAHWLSWSVGVAALLFTGLLQIYLHGMTGRVLAMRRKNAELLAKQAELQLAETVFDNAADAIVVTDAQGLILSANPMFTRITRHALADIQGHRFAQLAAHRARGELEAAWAVLPAEGRWEGEVILARQDGEPFTATLSIAAVFDSQGAVSQYVGTFSDITEKKAAQSQIEFMAFHDALTALPNRLLGRQRAQEAISRARRHGYQVAVLFMDLDQFKLVNDTYGHSVGDGLLKEVARRLRASVRAEDAVCRLSGDEFMLVLEHVRQVEDVVASCGHFMADLERPYSVDGRLVQTSVSVGIALYPADGENVEDLLRKADTAMFEAKQGGRNTYRFFDPAMNRSVVEFVETRDALHRALQNAEFELYYQPQIRLSDLVVTGVEALLRWHHPGRGLLGPGHFIPVAEQSGLIVPLGAWVIREACRQMRHWLDIGLPLQTVAVNLSGIQIRTGHVERTVQEALEAAGLPASHLELELTETILISDKDKALERLGQLKATGVRLSIDDFGTGYSSMAYLKRFNLDKVKIDASFAAGVNRNPEDAAIVRSIIQMAQALGLETTAEGVEQAEAVETLREMGCTQVQGYHFARPMPAAEFPGWLRDFNARRG